MSVKFDAAAAEKLIEQMDIFCSSIQRDAVDILDILEISGNWDDDQYHNFHDNIMAINQDLVRALNTQSEYMQIFMDRVTELRG